MSTRRKVASIAFTGAAAAAATAIAAPAAFATGGKWVIAPSAGAYSAVNSGNTHLGVSTGVGTVSLTCPTAAAAGNLLQSQPVGAPWAKVGSVSSATFGTTANPCALGTIHFTAKLNKHLNLSLSGTAPSHGRLHGSISATLTGVGNSCNATIVGSKSATAPGTGTVPGSWNNTTHRLNINPGKAKTLVVKNATHCTGIAAGEKAFFSAKYKLLAPKSNLTITDP